MDRINTNNAHQSTRNPWCGIGIPERTADGLTSSKLVDARFEEFIAPYPELSKIMMSELTKGPGSGADNMLRNYRTIVGSTACISEGKYASGDYITPPTHPIIPETGRAFLRLGLFHPDYEITQKGELLPRTPSHQLVRRTAISKTMNRRKNSFGRGVVNRGCVTLPTWTPSAWTTCRLTPLDCPPLQCVPLMGGMAMQAEYA